MTDPSGCPFVGKQTLVPAWEGDALRLPFEALPDGPPAMREEICAEALRINDRYLHEFIEEYAFCPFAREGRKNGSSIRRVHYYDGHGPEVFFDLMAEVAADEGSVVTQVIFPMLEIGPREWRQFCLELTDRGRIRMGGKPILAVAPLHPRLAYDTANPNALLTLFRRTPDPTIQWVRLDPLREIYKGRNHDTVLISPDDIAMLLNLHKPPPSLYDRIAETNMAMARRLGYEKVERILGDYAQEAQRNYGRILLAHTG